MQRARIKIRSVRPNERPGFRIQKDAVEYVNVLERTEERAVQYWPKVDVLTAPVAETDHEGVWPCHFKSGNSNDSVPH